MKSTKERDKRVGKKPQRKTNGDDLRRALNWILIDDIFAHVRLHGNVKWKPLALVCLAIFWVWSSQPGLVKRPDPTGLQVLKKCRVSGRRHFCHPTSFQRRGCENGRSTEDPASGS